MSVHVESWCWKQKVGSPLRKLVLVKLAQNADDDGYSWWRQGRMAEECETTRQTVNEHIATLRENGLVEVEAVPRARGGGRGINRYRIIGPWVEDAVGNPDNANVGLADNGAVGLADNREPSALGNSQEALLLSSEEPGPISDTEKVIEAWLRCEALIQHRRSYFEEARIRRQIQAAVKKYGADDVATAIGSYGKVVALPEFWFTYKWTFSDFLGRGLDKFVPEAKPEEVYRRDGVALSGPGGKMAPERKDEFTRDDS